MTSWEIAVVVGLVSVPFYLQRMVEKMEDEYGYISSFVVLINLTLLAGVIWVARLIANLNDSSITSILTIVFQIWLWFTFIVWIIFIGILIPMEIRRRWKDKKRKTSGMEIINKMGQ